MRAVDLSESELKVILESARHKGRSGDTDIVHVNEAEKKLLKEAGGAGTINPKTGLREYKYGGNVSEGGKTQGAKDAGGQGPNASGGSKSGERGTASQQQDRRNYEAARAKGNVGPGVKGSAADRASTAGMSPTDVARAAINRKAATKDFQDVDNTFLDEVGNFFAGLMGFQEMNPTQSPLGDFVDVNQKAQWGIDPIGAGLSLAGLAFPPAAIASKLYGAATMTGLIDPSLVGLGYDRARSFNQTAGNANTGQRGGTGGRGEKTNSRQTSQGRQTTAQTAGPVAPSQPDTTTPVKSPADVLLDKYKLPGINAPFALAPYTIDRTRHEQLVNAALQGR